MQDLNDKITGNTLTATEWNEVPSEIQNVIEGLGQTLSSGDLDQLGKSIAGYAANGTYYTDSGIADAYVLSKIGLKQSPTAYTNGFQSSFMAGNTNTGASTVNVAGLGVKNIKLKGGDDPSEFDVSGMTSLVFDSANDWFELVMFGSDKTKFISVDDMVNSSAITERQVVSTGATSWRILSVDPGKSVSLTSGLFAIPLNGVWIDDFIEDRSVDSTAAFDEAILVNRKIRITEGDYYVNDIDIKSETTIEGPLLAFMFCNVAGASVFLADTSAGDVTNIRLKGFTSGVNGNLAGCAFYRQTSMSHYSSYCQFEDLETYLDFETTYDIYPIYTTWLNGRDGFSGNLKSATHQALKCIPVDPAQAKTTNANSMYDFKTFNSNHADGAFTIQQGFNWNFFACRWEKNDTRAVHLLGIIGVNFFGCYFESNADEEQIFCSVTTGINAQGTRPVVVKGCHVRMDLTTVRFITFGSGSRGSVTSTVFTDLSNPGVVMTNTSLEEAYDTEAVSGAHMATFAASIESNRNDIVISSSELLAGNINSPENQNSNMFPIGPSNLGSTNFSVSNFTGLTDVATVLGGAGQAVQVTISGSGNAIWFTIPALLRDFFEGKTVTWSLLGFGDVTASPTAGSTAVWEDVTPTFANTTATGTGITSNAAELQQGTMTHTIGVSLTSLHFGFVMGGLAGSKPLVFETMSLQLGEIKSDGLSLV